MAPPAGASAAGNEAGQGAWTQGSRHGLGTGPGALGETLSTSSIFWPGGAHNLLSRPAKGQGPGPAGAQQQQLPHKTTAPGRTSSVNVPPKWAPRAWKRPEGGYSQRPARTQAVCVKRWPRWRGEDHRSVPRGPPGHQPPWDAGERPSQTSIHWGREKWRSYSSAAKTESGRATWDSFWARGHKQEPDLQEKTNFFQNCLLGLPWRSSDKNQPANAGDTGSIPAWGSSTYHAIWPQKQYKNCLLFSLLC